MKTLIISYSNHLDEGRLKELIKTANLNGEVIVFISSNEKYSEKNIVCVKKKSNRNLDYINFTYQAVKFAIKNKNNYQVIILDFLTSSLPGILLKFFIKDKFFIQDVRELAFPKDYRHFPSKVLSFLEGKMIKKSNIVIAANIQRAKIMQEHYKIKRPYNYENIRLLGPLAEEPKKIINIKDNGKFKIISTGGPSTERGIISILENFKLLPKNFELTIVGDTGIEDYNFVRNYLSENQIENVRLLQRVESGRLYNLVKDSHVGIVHYHFNDINNIYCASGKIYEYLGCLVPIATTENPPLKEFCEQFEVGVSNNNFKESLLQIYNNYDIYKSNVVNFSRTIDVDGNNLKLAEYIKKEYIQWKNK